MAASLRHINPRKNDLFIQSLSLYMPMHNVRHVLQYILSFLVELCMQTLRIDSHAFVSKLGQQLIPPCLLHIHDLGMSPLSQGPQWL